MLLAVGAGFCLIYPLIQGRQDGWPLWAFGMLAASAILIGTFAMHQSRQLRAGKPPLVDPAILRRRPYVAGLAVVLGFIGAMGGMTLTLNVVYQTGLGFSPLDCGLALLPVPLLAIAGSITSSVLLERLGRTTMHIGTAVMALGLGVCFVVMRGTGHTLTVWDLVGPEALTGFGMGMVFVPMFDVILAGVKPQELGSAAGFLESIQQLAMSAGIALVGTVLFDTLGSSFGSGPFVHAGADGLLLAVALLAAAWLAVWWCPRHTGHDR